ncbi:hypothetical protein ABLN72_08385, partial [Mycobacterium tuberculosis]
VLPFRFITLGVLTTSIPTLHCFRIYRETLSRVFRAPLHQHFHCFRIYRETLSHFSCAASTDERRDQ